MNEATWSLLRRNVAVRRLVASRLITAAGTWLAYVALTVDVYARTHSSGWVSAVLLADFVPSVAVVALAGARLDRIPRRTLVVGAEVVSAIVFALIPFAPGPAAIVALALVAGCAGAVYFPSIRAFVPQLVDADDLPHANALSQTVAMAGMAAGPVLAGVLVAARGVELAYLLNAASFVLSACLLLTLPRAAAEPQHETSGAGHWQSVLEGIRVYLESPKLGMALRVWMLAACGGALITVGEMFLARETFDAGVFGYGLLASASGVGLVAGSAFAPRVLDGDAARVSRIAVAAAAIGFGGAALAPNVWVAAVCVVAGGGANAVLMSACTLLVQQNVADDRLGRAFAVFDGAGNVALGFGMVAAGAVVGALGARGAWLVAAGLLGLAAISALGVRRNAVRGAVPELS